MRLGGRDIVWFDPGLGNVLLPTKMQPRSVPSESALQMLKVSSSRGSDNQNMNSKNHRKQSNREINKVASKAKDADKWKFYLFQQLRAPRELPYVALGESHPRPLFLQGRSSLGEDLHPALMMALKMEYVPEAVSYSRMWISTGWIIFFFAAIANQRPYTQLWLERAEEIKEYQRPSDLKVITVHFVTKISWHIMEVLAL